ncbi:MAG: purine-binding chemotaxis protein CheW [Deltaproteobacteria bacterium]|nr:purine-binding chemotaxis protein CheW [Deltaproteobacteria bacterium]
MSAIEIKDNGAIRKFLTFKLANEEYGISIMKIKEIIGLMPITVLPQTPDYVKGVINLRGKVIPIIDLRTKFGLEEIPHTERTCIVVIESDASDRAVANVGLVVDAVSEVLNIKAEDIEPPPTIQARIDKEMILGLAKAGKSVKILLDIDNVVDQEEFAGAVADESGTEAV